MKPEQANPETKGCEALRSKLVDGRRLIEFASFVKVLGVEPPPGDDVPITITVQRAVKLSGLSKRTIVRKIAAGSAAAANTA
jgi:hypothetical protein